MLALVKIDARLLLSNGDNGTESPVDKSRTETKSVTFDMVISEFQKRLFSSNLSPVFKYLHLFGLDESKI